MDYPIVMEEIPSVFRIHYADFDDNVEIIKVHECWLKIVPDAQGLCIEMHKSEPSYSRTYDEAMASVWLGFDDNEVSAWCLDKQVRTDIPLNDQVMPITLVANVEQWQPTPDRDGEEKK